MLLKPFNNLYYTNNRPKFFYRWNSVSVLIWPSQTGQFPVIIWFLVLPHWNLMGHCDSFEKEKQCCLNSEVKKKAIHFLLSPYWDIRSWKPNTNVNPGTLECPHYRCHGKKPQWRFKLQAGISDYRMRVNGPDNNQFLGTVTHSL